MRTWAETRTCHTCYKSCESQKLMASQLQIFVFVNINYNINATIYDTKSTIIILII